MPSYAIIGASRGIGLEFVRQLAARPDATVIAVVRNPAGSTHLNAAIAGLGNVHVVAADVANHATLERAAKQVSDITGGTLDVLIHVAAHTDMAAAMKGFDDFPNMDELDDDFITAFKVNALGTIHAITAFLPLLRASPTKKIAVVSTGGADHKSILAIEQANIAAYCMTKAAALIATTKFAIKLKSEGFVVVSLNPGIVDTSGTFGESGNPQMSEGLVAMVATYKEKYGVPWDLLTPQTSVSGQLKVIDGLKTSDSGLLLTVDGVEYVSPALK